jgi:hypothetical protein
VTFGVRHFGNGDSRHSEIHGADGNGSGGGGSFQSKSGA